MTSAPRANNKQYSNPEPGEVEAYLKSKGFGYFIKGDEIQFPCPHGDCDTGREHPEKRDYHCSINAATGQYHCVKCGTSGNMTTLKRLSGDTVAEHGKTDDKKSYASTVRNPEKMAKKCHDDMAKEHRNYIDYFMGRGISLYNINLYRLGCLSLNDKMWLTIPIVENGVCTHLKLRRPPEDETRDPKYKFYPKGAESGVFKGDELLKSSSDSVLICGGELDAIIAEQMDFGMPVISGTAGEGTFKEAWVDTYLSNRRNVYICFDADETGRRATKSLVEKIVSKYPQISVFKIIIPDGLGEHADLTDANKAGIAASDLMSSAEFLGGTKPIDASQFNEMTTDELASVLDSTIKYDKTNKVVIFLAMLSTYTEEEQLNIFLNAQSSSGKTYLVQEVSKYFPPTDVLDFCKVTPKAFYYNEGSMKTDKDDVTYLDLERKILIFYDQIDNELQSNLRSLLSHDKKKLPFMNTNKSKNGANTSKTSYFLGFSSTFFCSANMKMDEQEQTRAFLLSPEISQEKFDAVLEFAEMKMNDKFAYEKMLSEDKERQALIDRVLYIKSLNIRYISIPKKFEIAEKFKSTLPKLEPRSQRDITRLGSLIKTVTLLNAPFRTKDGQDLIAEQNDVDQGFELWCRLSCSQKYGISPQAFDVYRQSIVPAFLQKCDTYKSIKVEGITLKELNLFRTRVVGISLDLNFLRNQILPVLEAAGLIETRKNPVNKREILIVPLDLSVEYLEQNAEEADSMSSKRAANDIG